MDRPTDEEILSYERQIKEQEIGNTPLVSGLLSFENLELEYKGNASFIPKILSLKSKCYNMRTVKKDGNCFYRAFAFRFCEMVRERVGTPWHAFIVKKCQASKDILVKMGYDMSILMDFYEPFYEALTNVDTNLLEMFTTEYTSDTIVCFLRILTAAFLKSERDLYESFVLDSYPTLEAFLGACVEPMNVESDQIHIVAMANALNLTIKVANLDASPGNEINFHDISPMNDEYTGEQPCVGLLYRPGHYDIIYLVK